MSQKWPFILDEEELRKSMITVFSYFRGCRGYDCSGETTKHCGLIVCFGALAARISAGIKVKEKSLPLRANVKEISIFETMCLV